MIKKIKAKLTYQLKKSKQTNDVFLQRPPSGLKNKVRSENESFYDATNRNQGKSIQIVRVFIPDGLQAGQKVTLHYLEGSNKVQTIDIPPRSTWRFENCNGEPRPFFFVPIITQDSSTVASFLPYFSDKAPAHKIKVKEEAKQKPPSQSGKKACHCAVSLGVYDSLCTKAQPAPNI